ncbi:MAG: hypothetical protein IT443_07540 [Phycisphaeraceae bacterium]|nr:hypothetical protein [Phycisphaeraceae bacterium]
MMDQPVENNAATDMNVPLIATIGVVGSILIFVIVLGVQAWFFSELAVELETKSLGQRNWTMREKELQQLRNIDTYRVLDAQAGTVAIPIDRAMELTVQTLLPKETGP